MESPALTGSVVVVSRGLVAKASTGVHTLAALSTAPGKLNLDHRISERAIR